MKRRGYARDALYDHLDRLVSFRLSNKTKVAKITLSQAQFDIFKDFNIAVAGQYFYRDTEVILRS
jgi:hypothetical protein